MANQFRVQCNAIQAGARPVSSLTAAGKRGTLSFEEGSLCIYAVCGTGCGRSFLCPLTRPPFFQRNVVSCETLDLIFAFHTEFRQEWSRTGLSDGHAVLYHSLSGSVFSLGWQRPGEVSGNDSDAYCARFNADTGALVWQKQLHMGNHDWSNAAVADDSGVFVAGTGETGAAQSGSFIAKLNHTDGSILWSVQAGGTGAGTRNRNTKAVALSHNGTLLYVTGSICDSGVQIGSDKCYAYVETLRASDGSSLRLTTFGPGKMDEVRSIGLDTKGDLLLAGRTKGTLVNLHKDATATENGRYDYFLVKMNAATGSIQWSQQGKGSEDDAANSLTTHQAYVYITGSSHHASLPFAFWASFDLSNGNRRDNYNGLAGEAHSVLTIPGLQGSDGPFVTGQDGKNIFVHKYQLGKGTVASDALTPPTGKTLSGGQAALITELVARRVTGKALIIGGTLTTTSNTVEKSYVLYRLGKIQHVYSLFVN